MIVQKQNDKGLLLTTKKDQIGRADSRLVSLISKISRELKGNVDSLYHNEEPYDKEDKVILKFDWTDKDKVLRIVRLSSFTIVVVE